MISLDQLKMLIAAAEHGTLKAASQALHKTQPAISQGIAKLESSLNLKLFSRENYRLELTAEGKILLQQAIRIHKEAIRFTEMSSYYAQGNETKVTVAFEASFDLSKLLPILESAQDSFPETQIILKQEFISGAYQSLMSGLASIAITPASQQMFENNIFNAEPLFQGALTMVAAPKLISRHTSLHSAEQLKDEYQILLQDSGTGSKGVDMGVKPGQRRWYVNDFSTKKMLILSGMGWGKLPEFLVSEEIKKGTLVNISLDDLRSHIDITYYALKLNDHILGPVAQSLWESILAMQKKQN
jgi:DNA-binding transcriptional LysR family regulator